MSVPIPHLPTRAGVMPEYFVQYVRTVNNYLKDLESRMTGKTATVPPASSGGGGGSTTTIGTITPGTANQVLATNAAGTATEWRTVTAVANETNVSHAAGSVTIGLVDPLIVGKGGTGVASFNQGDVPYYNSGTALSALAKDTNATRYLSNTGASNNPAWAQVALTTGVSGILPIANGGTALSALGSAGEVLKVNAGATALEYGTIASLGAAPLSAQYVTLATDGTLTNERVLTGTANRITLTDNGAGSTVVLTTPQDLHTGTAFTVASLTDSGLTSGRVVLASTAGLLADNANFVHSLASMTATSGTETGIVVSKAISLTGSPSSNTQGIRATIDIANSAAYSGTGFYAVNGTVTYSGSGSVATVHGLRTTQTNSGSGTITTGIGVLIGTFGNTGGGHFTNAHQIDINAPVAITANSQTRYGIVIRAMPDPGAFTGCFSKGIFFVTAGTERDGISWNNHTNLYSSASDTLKTDDSFHVGADFRHLGSNVGFYNSTAVAAQTGWSVTNVTTTKTIDCDIATLDDLRNVMGTILTRLINLGLIQA